MDEKRVKSRGVLACMIGIIILVSMIVWSLFGDAKLRLISSIFDESGITDILAEQAESEELILSREVLSKMMGAMEVSTWVYGIVVLVYALSAISLFVAISIFVLEKLKRTEEKAKLVKSVNILDMLLFLASILMVLCNYVGWITIVTGILFTLLSGYTLIVIFSSISIVIKNNYIDNLETKE